MDTGSRIPSVIALLLIVTLFVGVWGMRLAMSPYIYTDVSHLPNTQIAMILGASVLNGEPSPVLAQRADAAIDLFRGGKVNTILVTGDNGQVNYDEVTPVRKYLIEAGIPPEDIFLDHAGFDTYSSMYRARDVFHVDSMTIVTQDFHMPRALFVARHLGITAYGYVAGGGGSTSDYMREVPASLKALFDIFTGRLPKYLGDPIPLSGTGTTTWY
jgi:SanA protein